VVVQRFCSRFRVWQQSQKTRFFFKLQNAVKSLRPFGGKTFFYLWNKLILFQIFAKHHLVLGG